MAHDAIRDHLERVLDWEEAHVGFDKAIADIPADKRGVKPSGFEYSAWQLLEHMRLAQDDIYDFCVNPKYVHTMKWPDDYWPKGEGSETEWRRSVEQVLEDLKAMIEVVSDENTDLFAAIAHGSGQTVLREAMLVADHNAYHLGQLMLIKKMLSAETL